MANEPRRISHVTYLRVLLPALLFWIGLVVGVTYLLYERSTWSEQYERATLEEWVSESRPFRKTLSTVMQEYLRDPTMSKREELQDQLEAMAEPIRTYANLLPLFMELYSLRISFNSSDYAPIEWVSPVPVPRTQGDSQPVRSDVLLRVRSPRDPSIVAELRCQYRMHAFATAELAERQRELVWRTLGAVVVGGITLATISILLFLRRERSRLEAETAREHAENQALTEKLRAEEARRTQELLERELLQQQLRVAEQESRAADAEKATLKMRSELFAGIGIMAGSYAHNIKNLLVRPNDLLARCIEANGLSADQASMLHEVQATLGTVTERLQQILKTVRRDPSRTEMTRLDITSMLREMEQTWSIMAREKWKLVIRMSLPKEPLWIRGDLSHLQQAIENLLFNARDATFEMRNHVRDAARAVTDAARRKQAIIDAAAWKGQVDIRAYREADQVVVEVKDNGIGMTPEVRSRCLQTHFSTKRDNAIFEGFTAGMGLGLSFVVVVLEHHHASLEIESESLQGSLFRVRFPIDSKES